MESIESMIEVDIYKKDLKTKILNERNRVRVVGPQMPRPLKETYYGRGEALDWVLKLLDKAIME